MQDKPYSGYQNLSLNGYQQSSPFSGQPPQGMFGGTATSRAPYTGYQAYQPYQGMQRTTGMFGAPTMNYNMRNRPMQPQMQPNQPMGWSQNNPYSMPRSPSKTNPYAAPSGIPQGAYQSISSGMGDMRSVDQYGNIAY